MCRQRAEDPRCFPITKMVRLFSAHNGAAGGHHNKIAAFQHFALDFHRETVDLNSQSTARWKSKIFNALEITFRMQFTDRIDIV